tara:strand:+ start:814 stop:2784 length:1971 start_codon:yes stop_codon:yes gene_type:complete
MADAKQRLLIEIAVKNQQALGKVQTDLKKIETRSFSLGKALKAATGALVAFGAIRVGQFILRTAAQFQDLRVALSAVTGSIEDGRKAFNFILDFAKSSIFEVDDLTNTFIKLKGAGIEPTVKLLTMFQDVASVTTDRVGALNAMTDLYSRTTAGGLGLEELNRLGDRGIPVFKMLSDTLGISRLQISKVGQSAEGAKLILDAMEFSLTKAFGGSAAALTNNYSQAVSNLNDAFSGLADSIGKGFLPVLTKTIKEVSGGTDDFRQLGEVVGVNLGVAFGAIAHGLLLFAKNFKLFLGLGIAFAFYKVAGAAIRLGGSMLVIGKTVADGLLAPLTKGKKLLGTFLNFLKKNAVQLGALAVSVAGAKLVLDEFDKMALKLEGTLGETNSQMAELDKKIEEMKNNVLEADGAFASFRKRLANLNQLGLDAAIVKEFEKLYNQIQLGTGIVDIGANAFRSFAKAVGDSLADAIVDGKNFAESMANAFRAITKGIISSITQLLIEVFVLELLRPKIEAIRDAIFGETKVRDQNTKAVEKNTKAKLINAAVSFLTGGLFADGGEVGYANGGKIGFGGARAGGGSVGGSNAFLVGERGPELFIPNSAGTVVSNETMGSRMGETNINFTINAVDAQGFDELLLSRKGLIIGTIQQAFRQQGRRLA